MTYPLASARIAKAFIAACEGELLALKPGNVHVHAPGHGMEVRHFRDAARAAAPWIANAALSVGARVEGAVDASFAAAGLNTNLGILLLAAPLARAADVAEGPAALRDRLAIVLAELGRDDADAVYHAIARASPAGLGRVDREDVGSPAATTLREAMALAADRDRIALAYITDFADVFEIGLPTLRAARADGRDAAHATGALHMRFLTQFPDTHITRKHGLAVAKAVRDEAVTHLASTPSELLEFDASLKRRGLNPGTTADLVVACLFADQLDAQRATKGPGYPLVGSESGG